MKLLLLTISCLIALPLAASEQLEQLYEEVSQSYRIHQYDATLAHAKELLQASKDEDNTYYIVRSYYVLGLTHSKTEDFGKAVLSYLEGARFAEGSSEKKIKENLISIYKNLAVIMGDYRHFDLAHKFNQKGLEGAFEINDEKQIIDLLHNDGYEYVEEAKYDSAINAFNRILTDHNPDFRKEIGLRNDIGIAYRNLRKLDEAITQYQSILDLRDSIRDVRFMAKVLHNLGLALMDKQEYEEALTYFKKATEINTREGFTNTLFGNYKNMGKAWYQLEDKDKAIEYYLKAAALFNEAYVDPEDYNIFELIASFYFTNNQHELAFQYEKQHNEHLQAFNETKAAMQLPAELLLQVEELLNENEVLSVRTRRTIIILSALFFCLFIGLALLYRHSRRKKQHTPKSQERQLMTRQELARELGISYHTMWRRLQESNIRITSRKYLTPPEQEAIIDYLNGRSR